MKLIKQHGRRYEGKDYFKYIVVIPNRVVEELKWKGGEELKVEVVDRKLVIEKS